MSKEEPIRQATINAEKLTMGPSSHGLKSERYAHRESKACHLTNSPKNITFLLAMFFISYKVAHGKRSHRGREHVKSSLPLKKILVWRQIPCRAAYLGGPGRCP